MNRYSFIKKIRTTSIEYFKKHDYETEEKRKYILKSWYDWKNNIINDETLYDFLDAERIRHSNLEKPFPLHNNIHHGLSSQACLFNLFGPIIAYNDFILLKKIISLSSINLDGEINNNGVEFEFSDKDIFNEKEGQPTSIDLYIRTNKSQNIFIEFKFTESEFGTCSVYRKGDCDGVNPKNDKILCYLHKIIRYYLNKMEKYKLFTDDRYCLFTEFYQAYRLLILLWNTMAIFFLSTMSETHLS